MAASKSTTRRNSAAPEAVTDPSIRTYVLDTSVLLADPGALGRFDEHEVVLPVVVITELEGKRHHPELGYFARADRTRPFLRKSMALQHRHQAARS